LALSATNCSVESLLASRLTSGDRWEVSNEPKSILYGKRAAMVLRLIVLARLVSSSRENSTSIASATPYSSRAASSTNASMLSRM
jgi:hypothetical protein